MKCKCCHLSILISGRPWATLVVLLTAALAVAAPPTPAAPLGRPRLQPGRGIGELALGLSRTLTDKLMGTPTKSLRLQGGLVEEYWLLGKPSYGPGIKLLFRGERIIQIETTLPSPETAAGDSVSSRFLDVLKRHRSLQATAYDWGDINGPAGYVKYFFDDVKAGVAFTLGTQDDEALSQDILAPNPAEPIRPISIIIHSAGRPAIAATGTARVSYAKVAPAMKPSFLYHVINILDL